MVQESVLTSIGVCSSVRNQEPFHLSGDLGRGDEWGGWGEGVLVKLNESDMEINVN